MTRAAGRVGAALAQPDELDAWLRLVHRTGVGRGTLRRLLAALGSPAAVASADDAALRVLVGERQAEALRQPPDDHAERVAATGAWLAGHPQRRVLTLADADYPPALLQTADPPLLLYLQGRSELLAAAGIAIVGSRKPTPQGLDNAHRLATELSRAGWTIVSGLATGIDGAAHLGGLQAIGSTIAVVGTGLDQVYPRAHRALAQRIAEEGLMLSEFALGMPPLQAHFPQRNRIIAGLTRGTLVVEAALRSGSLITARQAAEAGREVFAIPGSIHSAQARGCHALLREGAKLVETVDDILEELGTQPRQATLDLTIAHAAVLPSVAPTDDDEVLRALGHDPATLDALMARCGWSASALNVRLMELELDGLVARLPGGLFQRRQGA
ncbi:DNA-processing protein DprA [Aquabacterium sp.]|uniref:DNA-processing protein DprA n=1 Tax=Aquabacterium sp. TaxID=1872578 RepID=UPI002CDABE2B|nr:DNA-processing protein DprA [Aquabacterium sp.]HSW03677.1 DNA-processing protein DprA [Aquabacterium sp.]